MIAGPVQALSCLPYGVDHAIHEVAHAKEGYVAALGRVRFDETRLPQVDWNRQQDTPPLTRIPARFQGKALTRKGFTHSIDRAVKLEVACYGPWCASAPSGKKALVFLKQTDTGNTLAINPCGGHMFFEPTEAALKKVERCYLKGECPKPPAR